MLLIICTAVNDFSRLFSMSESSASTPATALNAMILANNLYDKNPIDIDQEPIMKEIVYYNEIDCKVMWEIHNLIRENN